MKPLTLADVRDIATYELERPTSRPRVIALKRHRRVGVGPVVSVVFENRDTVRFQVQEMMRAERIVGPERVQEELDIYNELLPHQNELSATLLIEVSDRSVLKQVLDSFIGVDRGGTTYLEVDREPVEGEYEGGRSNEVQVSAVHYVRFALTPAQAQAVRSGAPVALRIDHGGYRHRTELGADVREQLAADLAPDA